MPQKSSAASFYANFLCCAGGPSQGSARFFASHGPCRPCAAHRPVQARTASPNSSGPRPSTRSESTSARPKNHRRLSGNRWVSECSKKPRARAVSAALCRRRVSSAASKRGCAGACRPAGPLARAAGFRPPASPARSRGGSGGCKIRSPPHRDPSGRRGPPAPAGTARSRRRSRSAGSRDSPHTGSCPAPGGAPRRGAPRCPPGRRSARARAPAHSGPRWSCPPPYSPAAKGSRDLPPCPDFVIGGL